MVNQESKLRNFLWRCGDVRGCGWGAGVRVAVGMRVSGRGAGVSARAAGEGASARATGGGELVFRIADGELAVGDGNDGGGGVDGVFAGALEGSGKPRFCHGGEGDGVAEGSVLEVGGA